MTATQSLCFSVVVGRALPTSLPTSPGTSASACAMHVIVSQPYCCFARRPNFFITDAPSATAPKIRAFRASSLPRNSRTAAAVHSSVCSAVCDTPESNSEKNLVQRANTEQTNPKERRTEKKRTTTRAPVASGKARKYIITLPLPSRRCQCNEIISM